MIRPIGSLAPLLLYLAACSSETPVAPTDPVGSSPDHPEWGQSLYENGTTKEQFQFYLDQDREIKHGVYRAFYQSGSPQEEGFYKEGHKDSLWSYFDERGHTTLTHTWREGQRWNGPFRLYWPNGNLSEYGTYRRGQWHGAYSSYYPSGKTKIRARYVDNQLHGIYIELYESGNRKIMGSYSRGLKTRNWTYYAESGIELQREEYENGELKNSGRVELETFSDGSIKSITPLREGQIHGVYIEFWSSGQKRVEKTFENGRASGPAFLYWDNGQIKERGNYARNGKQGVWHTYSRNGRTTSVAEYDRNRFSGPYISYHRNGNVQWEGTYERGLRIGLWTNYSPEGQKRLQQHWEGHELKSVIDCSEQTCQ